MRTADTAFPVAGNVHLADRWTAPPPHSYLLALTDVAAFNRNAIAGGSLSAARQESNDVSSRFGRRLRELRVERRLTQSDMAKRFGIDRSFISDVERGRKSISLPLLEVLAIGLEVSLSALFEGL